MSIIALIKTMNETEKWQLERISDERMAFYRQVYDSSLRLLSGKTNLVGKHVIVYCEQGVGDILQVLRYVPLLLQGGCSITLHCPAALHRLVTNQWNVAVLEKSNPDLPDHDMHILSMDLPILFQFTNKPYIKVNEVILADMDTTKPTIGIAWEGNPDHPMNYIRSCPLRHFLQLPGTLVQLQTKWHLVQEGCKEMEEMTLLGVDQEDLYDAATIVNSVDYVVTVDTSLLHLAGAMGKPTYGLLAQPCDPRWGTKSDTTPWYPSVKLIRQHKERDWESAFAELVNRL
jgi:hypothetical protein